jgi:hypothetical protein
MKKIISLLDNISISKQPKKLDNETVLQLQQNRKILSSFQNSLPLRGLHANTVDYFKNMIEKF